jgi:kynureninase
MPRRARACLAEYADTWATRGIRAWEEGWWEMPLTVGNLVGRIIGASEGEVTMHQNVAVAQAIVHSCFDWSGRRNKIVSEAMNFHSNLYAFDQLKRLGARVGLVPSEDGITIPLQRMLAAIDEDTALVSISHVLFRSAFVQDLAAIARRAHECGAKICADIYQSAGTVPVDVHASGLDFAVGGSVKWLCGGPGAGYLYVRSDLRASLEPKFTGWMAHKRPFAFEPAPMDYADDGFRFLHGTPNVPAMYAARSGYEIIAEVGVERIRQKSLQQTRSLIDLAEEAGFRINSPRCDRERGGTVILDVADGYRIVQELGRRDILMDYRPQAGIRIAPHFYTADAELEQTIRAIADSRAD